jgi:hypothetical protein
VDEQLLRLLTRIKLTQDGVDFIAFLNTLIEKTYEEWLSTTENNDILKGKVIVLKDLVKAFETSDEKLSSYKSTQKEWL